MASDNNAHYSRMSLSYILQRCMFHLVRKYQPLPAFANQQDFDEYENKEREQIDEILCELNDKKFDGKSIRLIFGARTLNSEPELLFMAKDCASLLLNYKNTKDVILKYIRPEYKCHFHEIIKGRDSRPLKSYHKKTVFITEFGLYSLVMRSTMPKAIEFQGWVYSLIQKCRRRGEFRKLYHEYQNKINIKQTIINEQKTQIKEIIQENGTRHNKYILIQGLKHQKNQR